MLPWRPCRHWLPRWGEMSLYCSWQTYESGHSSIPVWKKWWVVPPRKPPVLKQVMGTLACTGRRPCYFAVWTFKDFKVVEIVRSDEFISDMLGQLESFFLTIFLPCTSTKTLFPGYTSHFTQLSHWHLVTVIILGVLDNYLSYVVDYNISHMFNILNQHFPLNTKFVTFVWYQQMIKC